MQSLHLFVGSVVLLGATTPVFSGISVARSPQLQEASPELSGEPLQELDSAAPAAPADPEAPLAAQSAARAPELPDALVARARELAASEYQARSEPALPRELAEPDYDHYRLIDFSPARSLWKGSGGIELQFFHRGYLYEAPVTLCERVATECSPIRYSPELFDFEDLLEAREFDLGALDQDLGFAGFSVYAPQSKPGEYREVASFLGASYFRLCGRDQAWGGSFRGLTIGTGLAEAEEFPAFVEHWIQRPAPNAGTLTIFSLLDSPSVAGAYALRLTADAGGGAVRADVALALFARSKVKKLGIAPLTSMFFYGENSARVPADYRPEVHDSDGLAIETQAGERRWRALSNPPQRHRVTRFELESPKGFGLMQRDREFASYEDLESLFDARPSLWVEPLGDWGAGAIELIEIPTNSEFNDNVVAFWCPDTPLGKGDELRISYSLLASDAPAGANPSELRVVATRSSRLESGALRFLIDFEDAAGIEPGADAPSANFAGSQVEVLPVSVQANPKAGAWRVVFDVPEPPKTDASLVLRLETATAEGRPERSSEQWIYLLHAEDHP